MKKLKAYLFPAIMLLTSLAMAAIAAYISVSGLGKLFAGAGATVLLMTGIIEFSKVVITTHLHNSGYKKDNWLVNVPLTIITVIIMGVTSLGVYGFLANGYTVTAGELDKNKGQVELVQNKIKNHETKIEGLKEQKKNYNNRSNKLTDLRTQQETRIDSLYKKGWYRSARKVEAQVKESNDEIKKLMAKSSEADSLIQVENEAIGELKNDIIDLNNSDVNAELGPLKYIASLTGLPMDNVINYIILVLIFIFDPAAVLLLVAANKALEKAKHQSVQEKKENPVEDEVVEEDMDKEFEELADLVPESTEESNEFVTPIRPSVEGAVLSVPEEGLTQAPIDGVVEEPKDSVVLTDYQKVEDKDDVKSKAEKFFEEKEKKKEEFIEMVEEKNKELSGKVDESDEIRVYEKGQDEFEVIEEEEDIESKDTLYTKLITVLFKNGEIEKGDKLPSYEEFLTLLSKTDIKHNEKLIRDFLAACNLIRLIDTSKGKREALKSFEEAKRIIKHI